MPSSDQRLRSVDLLRTFSIFSVLILHLKGTGQPVLERSIVNRLWDLWGRNGAYGVTVFFVISGFLITRMIHDRYGDLTRVDLQTFYRRRAARILPLLAVVVALGIVGLAIWPPSPARSFFLDDPHSSHGGEFWVSVGCFFFNWYRIGAGGGFGLHWDVLWSLAIEEQFYLFYPVLLLACAGRRRLVPALLVVWGSGPVARLLIESQYPRQWLPSFTNSFTGFEAIALGCLAFLSHHSGWFRRYARPLRYAGLVSGVIAYLVTDLAFERSQVWGPSWIGLSVATILVGAADLAWDAPGWRDRLARALARPGQLSYGLYLWHALAIGLLWTWLGNFSFSVDAALLTAVAYGLAWSSARWIEEPAYRALRGPR
jgi:peptidoglycan/LPS O-acetylase OafA/YrhL